MTEILNKETFVEKVEKAEGRVLVDFFATWCGPCKMLAPVIDELAEEYAGKVGIYKVDTDASPDLAFQFRIMAVPTLVLFEDGKGLCKLEGVESKERIKCMIDDVTIGKVAAAQ